MSTDTDYPPWLLRIVGQDYPSLGQLEEHYRSQVPEAARVLAPHGFHVFLGTFGVADRIVGAYELDRAEGIATVFKRGKQYYERLSALLNTDADTLLTAAVQAFSEAGYAVRVEDEVDPEAHGSPMRLGY